MPGLWACCTCADISLGAGRRPPEVVNQPWAGRFEPEARTEDLDTADLDRLARWSENHRARSDQDNRPAGELFTTSNQALGIVPMTESGIEGSSLCA